MIKYKSDESIQVSEISENIDFHLTQIKDNIVNRLVISDNNKIEAVMISKDEYEKMYEAKKILDSITNGLSDIEVNKTYPISELLAELNN